MHASVWLKSIVLSCVGAFVLAASAGAQNQAPIRLAFGFKPGQSARFGFQEVEILTNRAEAIRGGEAITQYQTEARVNFRALEESAEGLTVEMTYERVRFQADSPVIKEPPSFDTAAPLQEALENPLAPALLAVINKPIILHLSAGGEIRRVESPKVDVPDVKFGGVAAQMLTGEWITPRFQCVFSLTAPGPDAAASMWSVPGETPLAHGVAQNLRVNTMHVLDGVQGGFAMLTLGAKAEVMPYDGTDQLNPRNLRF
ncbi:MAG: hypothetical protein JNK58_03035, partial [Phycisphaerae bacterium]|nr:hypothetical protein [Phycisphaerae bacterium]